MKRKPAPPPAAETGFFRVFNYGQLPNIGTGWRYVFAVVRRKRVDVLEWASGDKATVPLKGTAAALGWIESKPEQTDPPRNRIIAGCIKRNAALRAARAADRAGTVPSTRPRRLKTEKAALKFARAS